MPLDPPATLPPPAETGLEKLFLFPEKSASLLNNGGLDLSYPISVELSLTHRCNLACLFCSDKEIRLSQKRVLGLGEIERLFSDLSSKGTQGVTIEGGGEPTLAKTFSQIPQLASKFQLALGLITNGLKLFTPLTSATFYSAFQWIRVSLDATDEAEFKTLKGRTGFRTTLQNIEVLGKQKKGGFPVLGVGYVLNCLNDRPVKIKKLALILRNLGVDYLHVRPVVDHPELVSSKAQLLQKSLEELKFPDFTVNADPLTDNLPTGNLGLPCLAHSLTSVISADGLVWFCGRLNSLPGAKPIGDLFCNSFSEIWDSDKRNEAANQVKKTSYTSKYCPRCRFTKYNLLLHKLQNLKTRDFI
ncbi:MAG: radical SAM protein [Deltaproteobacteria bacterium]|nr:radical SAM protein [Deltaproteobacteria bacterium]